MALLIIILDYLGAHEVAPGGYNNLHCTGGES